MYFFFRLACQCMAIILQLTESEKNSLINSHMDQKTSIKHMLFYYSKSNLSHEDYLKLYREDDQYITVEGVPLPIVGCPKKVPTFTITNNLTMFKMIKIFLITYLIG